jgi:hypothetical protein
MTTVTTIFSPQASCIAIAGSATVSASVPLPGVGGSVRIVNEGPNNCYVSLGVGAQTASVPGTVPSTGCTPVLSGEDVSFGIPSRADLQISVICRATATCVLLVQVGEGI